MPTYVERVKFVDVLLLSLSLSLQLESTQRHLHEANIDRETLYEQTRRVSKKIIRNIVCQAGGGQTPIAKVVDTQFIANSMASVVCQVVHNCVSLGTAGEVVKPPLECTFCHLAWNVIFLLSSDSLVWSPVCLRAKLHIHPPP